MLKIIYKNLIIAQIININNSLIIKMSILSSIIILLPYLNENENAQLKMILEDMKHKLSNNDNIDTSISKLDNIKIEDIDIFFVVQSRRDNNKSNEIRERILNHIHNIKRTHTFFTDETYGSKWLKLKKEWLIIIKKISDCEYDSFDIIKMGGRKNSIDFKINYIKDKNIISTKSLEFKFNAKNISKLPQILQVYEGSLNQSESYSSFYYDNYLKEYIKTDTSISNIEIPDKETYLKLVKKNDYNCNKFFKECYEKEENNKEINILEQNS
jgi:hypothetical protein